jgi:hypothetical protein
MRREKRLEPRSWLSCQDLDLDYIRIFVFFHVAQIARLDARDAPQHRENGTSCRPGISKSKDFPTGRGTA